MTKISGAGRGAEIRAAGRAGAIANALVALFVGGCTILAVGAGPAGAHPPLRSIGAPVAVVTGFAGTVRFSPPPAADLPAVAGIHPVGTRICKNTGMAPTGDPPTCTFIPKLSTCPDTSKPTGLKGACVCPDGRLPVGKKCPVAAIRMPQILRPMCTTPNSHGIFPNCTCNAGYHAYNGGAGRAGGSCVLDDIFAPKR